MITLMGRVLTVPTEVEAAERVARGANLLDEKVPGWAAKVDLDRLELREFQLCILGQVLGSYLYSEKIFGRIQDKGLALLDHGFTSGDFYETAIFGPEEKRYCEETDDLLRDAWERAVLARYSFAQ